MLHLPGSAGPCGPVQFVHGVPALPQSAPTLPASWPPCAASDL